MSLIGSPGGLRASILDGMCTWEIGGFSRCSRKPTSPCPFPSERPDFDSSPLAEKRPAPSTPWSERFNFIFWKKIFTFSPKVNLSTRLYSHSPPPNSCTSHSKQPPLTPEMSQEPTAVAGGGDLLHFDFRDPRRPPPRTCTSRTLVRTLCQGPAQNVTP